VTRRRPSVSAILTSMADVGVQHEAPGAASLGQGTLYVIHGSHACAAAKLMLDRKGIDFRTVTLPTGIHPQLVRLRGFPGSTKPMRMVDGRPTRMSALLDRLGTVPALRLGPHRMQRNHEIARTLERLVPEPRLFPEDAEQRAAVEEAEAWADEPLQMLARRLVLAAPLDRLSERGARGRLGALLAGNDLQRKIGAKLAGRTTFAVNAESERRLRDQLPAALDRADGYFAAGVIGGAEPNVADIMIAPSLALLDYRLDLREELRARPVFAIVERLLPEPA
jgi:glutathione S-transferase